MKLRVRALGLTFGVCLGLGIFVATIWAVIQGRGKTLEMLAGYCFGLYAASIDGAFLGLIWGLVYGFIAGAMIAWLYNTFSKVLYKSDITVK